MKIKEVIVVEGRDDTVRIKLAVDADTIETNGSALNQHTLEQIKHAKEKRGVIVFTDPDYPGERLRRLIDAYIPGCKHAFLPKEKAKAKGKRKGLGIEHAHIEDIQQALKDVYTVRQEMKDSIDWRPYLLHYGLIGGPKAKDRRMKLGNHLKIGYANAKQLEKRLSMFAIDEYQFEAAMKEIIQNEIDKGWNNS
ncbi:MULTISPECIES: ribonuclease M5 [Allobacillus]|uniref:Ribonuclease M5 n=1 Tax=Allobacillus halotolerans TaxID=570278 RepID=A0ABS6GLY7_9BACI|nr:MULTISPECIES: ribonuclease M5 [Allobacillus]MBU6080117.1 ribonuclease M5 [Allobacillus halotolerans]TSJ65431.1 ribonuclease M5 [Allobacillus sp. SKP2-8]